jgi:hypothetical protein
VGTFTVAEVTPTSYTVSVALAPGLAEKSCELTSTGNTWAANACTDAGNAVVVAANAQECEFALTTNTVTAGLPTACTTTTTGAIEYGLTQAVCTLVPNAWHPECVSSSGATVVAADITACTIGPNGNTWAAAVPDKCMNSDSTEATGVLIAVCAQSVAVPTYAAAVVAHCEDTGGNDVVAADSTACTNLDASNTWVAVAPEACTDSSSGAVTIVGGSVECLTGVTGRTWTVGTPDTCTATDGAAVAAATQVACTTEPNGNTWRDQCLDSAGAGTAFTTETACLTESTGKTWADVVVPTCVDSTGAFVSNAAAPAATVADADTELAGMAASLALCVASDGVTLSGAIGISQADCTTATVTTSDTTLCTLTSGDGDFDATTAGSCAAADAAVATCAYVAGAYTITPETCTSTLTAGTCVSSDATDAVGAADFDNCAAVSALDTNTAEIPDSRPKR